MKKISLLSTVVLLLTVLASFTAKVSPKVVIKTDTFDFGDIRQGDVKSHSFTITNDGDAPLLLFDVRVTCGCTAPNWTRQAIAPGQSTDIQITFDSKGKQGIQNKVITVISNASNQTEHLYIKANVLPSKK